MTPNRVYSRRIRRRSLSLSLSLSLSVTAGCSRITRRRIKPFRANPSRGNRCETRIYVGYLRYENREEAS